MRELLETLIKVSEGESDKLDSVRKEILSRATENEDGTYDVKGSMDLRNLGLESLDFLGITIKHLTHSIACKGNNLKDLKGAPQFVHGDFFCHEQGLTSLEGAPSRVSGSFMVYRNDLSSLEGSPKYVGGNFDCSNNSITSLEGSPDQVDGNFVCGDNLLTSLEGAPKIVKGYFQHSGNSANFTNEDIKVVTDVGKL